MSLRGDKKAYPRQKNEAYFTPASAIWPLMHVLLSVGLLDLAGTQFWEPAAGAGHIAKVIKYVGKSHKLLATDFNPAEPQVHPVAKLDFLKSTGPSGAKRLGMITNPPYGSQNKQALAFIKHGLKLLAGTPGFMALLLPFEIDRSLSRNALFVDHDFFAAKCTLGSRIRWVNLPQSENGPMGSHAWCIWCTDERIRRHLRMNYHGRVV